MGVLICRYTNDFQLCYTLYDLTSLTSLYLLDCDYITLDCHFPLALVAFQIQTIITL